MKNIIQLLLAISIFTFAVNSSQAQNFNDDETLAFVDFNDIENHNKKYDSKSILKKSELELAAKAEAYDNYVSKDFGSYLNPYNGTLNIVNNENTHFTKAQFLNKSTNKNIFSVEIDTNIKTINISNYSTGDYTLILSNNNGDILIENFIII